MSCDREYPPICFEYKTTSEVYVIPEILTKQYENIRKNKKNKKSGIYLKLC